TKGQVGSETWDLTKHALLRVGADAAGDRRRLAQVGADLIPGGIDTRFRTLSAVEWRESQPGDRAVIIRRDAGSVACCPKAQARESANQHRKHGRRVQKPGVHLPR